MNISQIEINNFRSIKELVVTPNRLAALIGANSAGKTNILKAIDLVLGEGWTTKAKVARELFYDTAEPIEIVISFSSPVEFQGKRGNLVSVSSIKLKMELEPELTVKTTINGDETTPFYEQETFKKLVHFIYIPSERQLTSELRVSQWTMLGKLMKLIYENYIIKYGGDEDSLKEDFKSKMAPAKNFLEDDFSSTNVTFKKFVDVFQKYCKQNSNGMANDFTPVLDIYNLNWFYKTLQILVKEQYPAKHFDSEEVGSGMRNLLMISIFQTYSELMAGKVIFGIEEPEIYLYPHAQRGLYKNFIKLSEQTQILYTTHNPNFVDAGRPEDMIILRKDESRGTYPLDPDPRFSTASAEKYKFKIYTHFKPERNEIFFANKVLLVEGDSDKILFTTLCENLWNIELDDQGASIIECGGKAGVAYFIGVCKLIGFTDYFAVWDEDEELTDGTILADVLADSKGLELKPNLELFLGLPGGSANKVENAYKWASSAACVPPTEFNSIKEFLDLKTSTEASATTPILTTDDIPF